ncbi:MAG: hypothetical protein IKS20_00275, partial [Victivallales bacterium]|nr:hypothetical protein [Victivallales bacterium]
MNGLMVDSTIMQEGAVIIFGLSNASAQAAAETKAQVFDGMVMPMAQNLADGIAPGKIKTADVLKSGVNGKLAILTITLKNQELELFKSMQ